MIVLFHENIWLLSTNNFIVIPITFWAFVYDSAKKQMLSAISLVVEQRKNEFERIEKVWFFSIYFYALRRWYHFPDICQDLFSQGGDIASTQNLLISFKPIICKLNYSHVIIDIRAYKICSVCRNHNPDLSSFITSTDFEQDATNDQELFILPEHLNSPLFLGGFVSTRLWGKLSSKISQEY